LIGITTITLLLAVPGTTARGQEIVLQPSAVCSGGFVTLGAIAEIRTGDAERAAELAALPLVPPPQAGGVRVLRVREIQELLDLRGVNTEELHLSGASRVELRTSGTAMEADTDAQLPRRGKIAAVVVLRNLGRGEVIREEDVERREVSLPPRGVPAAATNVDEVLGLATTRPLLAGQVVDKTLLQRPVLIIRGATVSVVARVGGIQVTTLGRALENGARDDIIPVALLDNRDKRVTGRVVGLDAVEVLAQGASVAPIVRPSRPARPRTSLQVSGDDRRTEESR
jgi:flagella basal body P-ring formation protein FlgA